MSIIVTYIYCSCKYHVSLNFREIDDHNIRWAYLYLWSLFVWPYMLMKRSFSYKIVNTNL